MSNIRDAAMGFEAVKVSMSQDRNGIILRLNVHDSTMRTSQRHEKSFSASSD
jgi:hypothetical protein